MVADAVSLSFLLAFIIPIIMFIKGSDFWWLKLLAYLVITNIGVEGLKMICGTQCPRPTLANNCNAFCRGGAVGGEPGFPSGHMTTSTMFVVIMWLRFGNNYILLAGVPWLLIMAWSRMIKQCHTWQQICAGMFTGLLFALLFALLFPLLLNAKSPWAA